MRFTDALLPAALLFGSLGPLNSTQLIWAQTTQTPSQLPTQPHVPVLPGSTSRGDNSEDESPMARQLAEQQAIRRNNQRQKQIVDDTAKLVQLAQQLKDDLDKGKAGDVSFAKKAEEIEKLAKSVKEKMREGQ